MRGIPALLEKDWFATRNLRIVAREQSAFKIGFILLFATGMLVGLWLLFAEGFHFLDSLGGVGLMLVYRLFALFFLGLSGMLVLSSILSSFTTFFRDEETAFLLLKPLSIREITIYKFLQSAFYSSWAFFFTIIPFIAAYAWHERMPVWFSIWAFVLSIPLVLLCSGIGTLVCLVAARWLPRGRTLAALLVVLAAAGAWWASRAAGAVAAEGDDATLFLNRLVPGIRLAANPLWPSWWVSEGIMALTRGQWQRGLLLFGVLVANVLLITVVVGEVGRRLFYDGWQRAQFSASRSRRRSVLLGVLEKALFFVSSDLRAMVVKDIRVFLRDPGQWSQGLIFFGLLALYFFNLRSLRYHMLPDAWRNLIAFLNVFSVSAVMCSFGSRFVYPQLSLEGHGFWIVGMSPTTMARVLAAKFGLALLGLMTVSVLLMTLSTHMLLVPAGVKAVAIGVSVAMSFAICGMSTGLGAVFMDLRQPNPAAIVSGFGGTLNLVLTLGFMFAAIVPFGFAYHLHFAGHISDPEFNRAVLWLWLWLTVITILAVAIPLWLGNRSLKRREY